MAAATYLAKLLSNDGDDASGVGRPPVNTGLARPVPADGALQAPDELREGLPRGVSSFARRCAQRRVDDEMKLAAKRLKAGGKEGNRKAATLDDQRFADCVVLLRGGDDADKLLADHQDRHGAAVRTVRSKRLRMEDGRLYRLSKQQKVIAFGGVIGRA